MPKPPEITREFTRGTRWTAAQIKVLDERKTIAKLEAENRRLGEFAMQLLDEINTLISTITARLERHQTTKRQTDG